jgi:ferrous iron transport protein B
VTYSKGYINIINNNDNKCLNNCKKCKRKNRIKHKIEVIDVPGTYRINPENDAEKVATDMLEEGDILVNVVDSTNLEKNLNLTIQLLKYNKPIIVVLNMWDEAKHKGISIDSKKLSEILNVPVICTSGLSGKGINDLIEECVNNIGKEREGVEFEDKWAKIGEIIDSVQDLSHRHHTFLERIQDISIDPIFGIPFAVVSLFIIFNIVFRSGEFLVGIMEQLFNYFYSPFIFWLSNLLLEYNSLHYILLGDIGNSIIDYESAMGVLTTGVFMTLGLVLPYIFVFYIVFGFLEDLGYLPRIAIIFDKFFHNIGLHGFSIMPMLLAFGCNVPGIMAIRNLETKRERFITAVLTSITIPCVAQFAIVFSIIGMKGFSYFLFIIITILSIWMVLGSTLKYFVRGNDTSLLLEIPPYRFPGFKIQVKTLFMRLRGFITEAVPYVLGGIFVINILKLYGVINFIGNLFKPIVQGAFGLPQDSVSAFIVGLVRKDAAVILLKPFNLTDKQLLIAVVLLIIYFPCMATVSIIFKELKIIDGLKAMGVTVITTIIVGSILNILLIRLNIPYIYILFMELASAIIYVKVINMLYIKKYFQTGDDEYEDCNNIPQ